MPQRAARRRDGGRRDGRRARSIDLRNYQPFLFLLGSFFVPLFGVLLADWLLAGCRYRREDIFSAPALRRRGRSSRGSPASASTSGSIRKGRRWWTRIVAHTDPHALPWGGASLPSFAAAFALTSAAGLLCSAGRLCARA